MVEKFSGKFWNDNKVTTFPAPVGRPPTPSDCTESKLKMPISKTTGFELWPGGTAEIGGKMTALHTDQYLFWHNSIEFLKNFYTGDYTASLAHFCIKNNLGFSPKTLLIMLFLTLRNMFWITAAKNLLVVYFFWT